MTENNHEQLHPIASAVARAAFAVIAFGGGMTSISGEPNTSAPAVSASAEIPIPNPNTTGAENANQTSEVLFPSEAQEFANRNVVYLFGEGCSGTLIHQDGDLNAPPVGVAFAKHCGLLDDTTTRAKGEAPNLFRGAGGRSYNVRQPIVAEIGVNQDNMTPIGQIAEVIIGEGNASDFVLGVLPGATAREVMRSYRQERLSDKEINELVPGESTIYMRGWPVNQEETKPNDMTAQQFAMTYIGTLETPVSDGEVLKLLVTAIPKSERKVDDSVCSFGASGSNGFVIQDDGQPKFIGTLSAFWGFNELYGGTNYVGYDPSEYLANIRGSFPDVNWSKYAAACGFNYEIPKSTRVIDLVPDNAAIPGEGYPVERSENQASLRFSNPNISRTIVDGTAVVSFPDKGGQYGELTMNINNPLISVGQNGDLMLGYNGYPPGTVSAVDVSDGCILSFYPKSPNDSVNTQVSTGSLIYPSSNLNVFNQSRYIKDSNHLKFGKVTQESASRFSNETAWTVTVSNDGQFTFAPENTSLSTTTTATPLTTTTSTSPFTSSSSPTATTN